MFINLPSEEYDIGEIYFSFETMGIDVTVNLNAFDHNLGRDKKIRGMGWSKCHYFFDEIL